MSAFNILQTALDASALRQQTISNNIANAETPRYQPQRVVFEDVLQAALSERSTFQGYRTDPRHLEIGTSKRLPRPVMKVDRTIHTNDENGVDLDYEMASLARNSIWYNALAQQLNHEFNLLKTVINGRGR